MGFTEKPNIQEGLGFTKNHLKRGAWTVFWFKRRETWQEIGGVDTPMHSRSSQHLLCTNLKILNALSFFCFIQVIQNITISGNCHVRIYKSHMHKHFYFCSVTIFCYKCCVQTYWSCIHKCIGAYSKILVNWKKIYTDKKNKLRNMIYIDTHKYLC